ncbi:MAG: hypothetical protein U5K43_07720 [Halofilum sp. (in: g-proteobacteria)]|nr:hypothetical protein [Halofilum sp. (in: g-proteobacteria)]
MQRPEIQPVDPAYIDALMLQARRERSEYIGGLVLRAARAVRARLASAGGAAPRVFHGRTRTA